MKFWESENINDYELYEVLKKSKDWGRMAEWLPSLLTQYPKLIPYIVNRIDSCFGTHIVYLVKTNKGIKIGYTKNSIKDRFSESRYEGSDSFRILEVLREDEFQALGAVQFESKLKQLNESFGIKTDMVMPGKGELYDEKFQTQIISNYDRYKMKYKDVIGIKPPN
jgi:hypothetical protein